MTTGTAEKLSVVSRIGQRRQVIIPKQLFEQLRLNAGDFVEFISENGKLQMRPKRLVDIEESGLTPAEAIKVHRGEREIRSGNSKSWRAVKRELA